MKAGYRKNTIFGNLMLVSCAVIWGFALVAQKNASDTLNAFSFNGLRYFLAVAVLLCTYIVHELICKRKGTKTVGWNKSTFIGGALCGIGVFFGNNLQQIGVAQTTVGKAGFITVLYIVIVPLLGLLLRRKPSAKACFAIVIALIGFFLMSIGEGEKFVTGDLIVLASALMIAFQIVFVDIYVQECDPIKLTLIQFVTAAVMSVPAMAIEGFPLASDINANIIPVLYVGILSAGVAFTLQSLGQRHTDTTTASLLMSLESVVGMIGGMLFFNEVYTAKELVGCALVLASVVIAQLAFGRRMLKMNNSKFFVDTPTL